MIGSLPSLSDLATPADPSGKRQFLVLSILGGLATLVGFSGFPRQLQITVDAQKREILRRATFFGFQSKTLQNYAGLRAIEVRKTKRAKNIFYRVILTGKRDVEFVSIRSEETAKEWATRLSAHTNIPIQQDPEGEH